MQLGPREIRLTTGGANFLHHLLAPDLVASRKHHPRAVLGKRHRSRFTDTAGGTSDQGRGSRQLPCH